MAMDNRPDSALMLLESITTSQLAIAGKKSRAHYALLLTQARHKNYIEETNDSLIATAVHYYERHSDPPRLMLAYYYHGVVLSNALNYAPAIISLMKAESLAQELDDNLFYGRACHYISEIYNETYSSSEEVRYDLKAYNAFKNSNDSVNLKSATENLIVGLNNAKRHNEAIEIAKYHFNKANLDKDTTSMALAIREIGYAEHQLGNYKESATAYLHYRDLKHGNIMSKGYYNLITSLWNANERATATHLIDSIIDVFGDKAMLHPEILYDLGRKEEAYIQQKRAFRDADNAIGKIKKQNIASFVAQYYDNEIELKKVISQRDRIIFIIITFTIILILLFSLYRTHLINKERKSREGEIVNLTRELSILSLTLNSKEEALITAHQRLDSANQELNITTQKLNNTSKELDCLISELNSKNRDFGNTYMELDSAVNLIKTLTKDEVINKTDIFKLKKERLSIILVMSELYHIIEGKAHIKSRTTDKVIRIAHEFTSDPNLMSELEERINLEKDGLMVKLRSQLPDLSQNEYWIFIWNIFRISPSTIEFAWKLNRNSYYTLRRRLREKISNSNLPDSKLFSDILY